MTPSKVLHAQEALRFCELSLLFTKVRIIYINPDTQKEKCKLCLPFPSSSSSVLYQHDGLPSPCSSSVLYQLLLDQTHKLATNSKSSIALHLISSTDPPYPQTEASISFLRPPICHIQPLQPRNGPPFAVGLIKPMATDNPPCPPYPQTHKHRTEVEVELLPPQTTHMQPLQPRNSAQFAVALIRSMAHQLRRCSSKPAQRYLINKFN